jgi:cytochrome c peroxidase
MNKTVLTVLWCATLLVAGVIGWRVTGSGPSAAVVASTPPSSSAAARTGGPSLLDLSPIRPLPEGVPVDGRKVALGDRLFHETRLSKDGTISCASCHDLTQGGDDGQVVSRGVGGALGSVNAPTVLNSGFNFRQFWDGRAASLEEQVDGPLLHPAEMANSWDGVLDMLQSDKVYAKSFGDVYADGVTRANVRDAIATFERSLVTPNSRFDRWLRGEADALTVEEQEGFRLFVDVGCITCHQGVNVGGNLFEVLGRSNDYFKDRGSQKPADLGRFNVTGNEADKHKFKVPALRNIELTAPYLHDGSAATLQEAVQVMANYQIGRELQPHEVDRLVAFLRTLTGENAIHP